MSASPRGLVGRADETAALRTAIDAGEPVVVVGEGGIGKTSLLEAAVAGLRRPVHFGGGLAVLQWCAYFPLRRAFGAPPAAGDAVAVAEAYAYRVRDGVLVLDDLQFADAETLDALAFLAVRVPFVGALRPDDAGAAPAREVLERLGARFLRLAPLAPDAAATLLASRRPDLDEASRAGVMRCAGGNPLLLEELDPDGAPSDALERTLLARLQRLPPQDFDAAARLAILGRAAEPGQIAAGSAARLVASGIARDEDGRVGIRHGRLAEAIAGLLSPAQLRQAHLACATAVPDAGEAARHHAAAGDLRRAAALALQAADDAESVGERVRHLAVAAACTDGPEGVDLRLQAAAGLIGIGRYADAVELAKGIGDAPPLARAEAALWLAEAHWFAGERAAAEAELARGMELAAGTGGEIEVRLCIERARMQTSWYETDTAAAREAWTLAERVGVDTLRARLVLGRALYHAADESCLGHLEACRAQARAEGDVQHECDAAAWLAIALRAFRRSADAYDLAREMRAIAHEAGLGRVEATFAFLAAHLELFHAGDLVGGLRAYEELAFDQRLAPEFREEARGELAIARADVGDAPAARAVLARAFDEGPTPGGAQFLHYARSEVEWLSGRQRRAIEAAAQCEGIMGLHAAVPAAWAAIELGIEPPAPGWRVAPYPALEGMVRELGALERLAAGDHVRACQAFTDAAAAYDETHRRGALRCRWAAGEAARRAGDRDRAAALLEHARADAEAEGHVALAGRIRQSLRRAGGAAGRGDRVRAAGLTGQEDEILRLVGDGLSTAQAAGYLGVRPSTVDTLVRSAMLKLGAQTRRQAAALAHELRDG
jgi:DNA-binding CsgD family transcriptional regulator